MPIAVIVINFALLFYSIGVWSERIQAGSKCGTRFSFGLVLFVIRGGRA